MMDVHILYPDNRMVSEEQIISWACDMLSDEGDGGYIKDIGFEEAKEILADSGEVTFAKCIQP